MSLITRCPACTTTFKVVPDQLRVSEGWVRCGQCDEVFDANSHLQTPPESQQAQPYDWGDVPVSTPPVTAQETETYLAPEQVWAMPAEVRQEVTEHAVARQEPVFETSFGVDAEAAVSMDVRSEQDIQPTEELPIEPKVEPKVEPEIELDIEPAFMRGASPLTSAHQPTSAWRWGAMGGLMVGLLLFQWMLYDRDRIAAKTPAIKPVLDALCTPFGCAIAPLRSIDSVVIDSSAFVKTTADVYQLSFVVKNNALFDIATPSLEITLTDMQDQPLLRRVISPLDIGRSELSLRPGTEWVASKTIALAPSTLNQRVSGYRLLAFYP